MDLSGDDRGQSVQVGFVILFGILVIMLSIFQGAIVPNQNQTVEFNHYQEVRGDMTVLYTEMVSLGTSSKTGQILVPVNLGTRYPARLLFINPPPATGTIQSSGQGNISINTNEPNNSPRYNATNICGGSRSTGLVYSPEYQESTLPDIRYDNGLLYVETADSEYVMLENQRIVNESTNLTETDPGKINIYRTSGRLEAKSEVGVLPIELTGTNTYGKTDAVQLNDSSEIELPTNLADEEWNNSAVLGGNVYANSSSDGTVTLTNFSEGNYTIQCYTTGLGERPDPPAADKFNKRWYR